MGKKDKKKGKGAEKTAAKTEKKANQKLRKRLEAKGEDDVATLLARYTEAENKKMRVIEEVVSPPSKRSAFTFTPLPNKDQIVLFGGEYFNGTETVVYNDLFFYNIKHDRWLQVQSPGAPPPRCSHQTVAVSQGGGQLWVFGGEFTCPSQAQYHHYKDLWVFYMAEKRWEKILAANGPPARSGHRMVAQKKQLICFGGFIDNLRDYQYFDDVYAFSLENYEWTKLETSGHGPCPRSGCQMIPLADGRILIYGGYSKEKVKKDVDRGNVHSDMFLLAPEKHDTSGTKWKWQSVKHSGVKPSPRCAFSMALSGLDKAVLFGGVCDEEDDDELKGAFYNDLYQLDLNRLLWHEVTISGKKDVTGERRRRRKDKGGESDEMEAVDVVDERLQHLNVTEGSAAQNQVLSDGGVFTVTLGPAQSDTSENEAAAFSNQNVFLPPPRINAGLAVKRGVLFLYGGIYEEGDKQLTLNDFYALDLSKPEEWQTIIPLKPEDVEWFDSDSGSSDDDSEAMDEDDDDDALVDEGMETN